MSKVAITFAGRPLEAEAGESLAAALAAHAEKLGPAYARMGAERGQHDPWTPDLVAKVEGERRQHLPLDAWEERVAWRDREMMRLLAHRRADRS